MGEFEVVVLPELQGRQAVVWGGYVFVAEQGSDLLNRELALEAAEKSRKTAPA